MACVSIRSLTPCAEISPVCPGGQITLTCISSTRLVQWTLTFPQSVELPSVTQQISSTRVSEKDPRPSPVTVNETVTIFHFLRRSDYNTTPLVTSLLIENISAGINGTNVQCSAIPNSGVAEGLQQFMILVIDSHVHGR